MNILLDEIKSAEEYVAVGHPDKLADQISDAVLDAYLSVDPQSRVACECLVTNNLVVVSGEISSTAIVDIEAVTRQVVYDAGYHSPSSGIDALNCKIMVVVQPQSLELSRIVHEGSANDQSTVIGYATNETPEFMPKIYIFARRLALKLSTARVDNVIPFLFPDGKVQVVSSITQNRVIIHSITISPQRRENIVREDLVQLVRRHIVEAVIPKDCWIDEPEIYIGDFVTGGPASDTGLTGRKIVIDSYGNSVPHGGGAFSGKDPTKIDRTGAYFARYLAKNIVAQGFAERALIRLSYSKGIAQPTLFDVLIRANGKVYSSQEIRELLQTTFRDMSTQHIIEYLNLRQPIYLNTARWGHFGRSDVVFPWENLDLFDL